MSTEIPPAWQIEEWKRKEEEKRKQEENRPRIEIDEPAREDRPREEPNEDNNRGVEIINLMKGRGDKQNSSS